MNLAYFSTHPFIRTIAKQRRWTVSTNTKMPIDMNQLRYAQRICGATFTDGNEPLVSLDDVQVIIPNATNAAYLLNQALDQFIVLDIEPKCPPQIRDDLLRLPYSYCEISMSGKGFHLVFETPDTQHKDVLLAKAALQHPSRWYEFLLNHYVTFTGNICTPPSGITLRPKEDVISVFDELAEHAIIASYTDIDTSHLPSLHDIPYGVEVVNCITATKAPYNKTQQDFLSEDGSPNQSGYEFGVAGFYFKRLKMMLSSSRYATHEYTELELMILLYEIVKSFVPARDKHAETREGLPYLMYSCKRVVTFRNAKS